MTIKEQITELLKALNKGVYEKETEIKLALLSAIAGESIFLLGAPGVAKSLIARRLKYAFKDGKAFEYLMSRFSTPDEIFGPVSISKLKDEDKYERIVKNYLPDADVVFLDEIWKAGPSIQNALLTVLNEKIYRNGDQDIKVPMKALISASNELPASDQGLEALWDRFLVRLMVEGIKEEKNFNEMIANSFHIYEDNIPDEIKLTEEIYAALKKAIDKVEIPDNVFGVIHAIRNYINTYNQKEENKNRQIYVSDRRWRKIIHLLRTSALLNDRTTVDLMDCFLICHCLWNEPEQRPLAEQFVKDAVQKHGYSLSLNLNIVKEEIKDFDTDVKKETSFLKPVEVPQKFYSVFYYVENLEDKPLIKITDYNGLSSEYKAIPFSQDNRDEYYRNNYRTNRNIKLSNKPNHIVYEGKIYKLKVDEIKEAATKRPHPAVKKDWDNRVSNILKQTKLLREQIESYKTKDLAHLRINLFVTAKLADLVESNLENTLNTIGKFELDVKAIKHYYQNVQDQS